MSWDWSTTHTELNKYRVLFVLFSFRNCACGCVSCSHMRQIMHREQIDIISCFLFTPRTHESFGSHVYAHNMHKFAQHMGASCCGVLCSKRFNRYPCVDICTQGTHTQRWAESVRICCVLLCSRFFRDEAATTTNPLERARLGRFYWVCHKICHSTILFITKQFSAFLLYMVFKIVSTYY